MAFEGSKVAAKEVLDNSESTTTTETELPIAVRKRKPSHTSDEYDSDSTSSFEDDRISNEYGVENENVTRIQAIKPKDTNTLTRYTTGVSTRTGISVATTTDPNFEIDFEDGDPSDPHNWPFWYRCLTIFTISYSTLTVVMYSTSYTSGIPGIMSTFNIDSKTIPVLGITTYMIGLALGSVVLAPLSEMYGRRPIYLIAMAMFCLLTIPCALASNLEAILITRFFGAIAGSALISNSPGTVNDIVTEEYRALAFSLWSIGPMNGPVVGPLVGGFVFQYLGWRWVCPLYYKITVVRLLIAL
jgi:multidrug resistance protein